MLLSRILVFLSPLLIGLALFLGLASYNQNFYYFLISLALFPILAVLLITKLAKLKNWQETSFYLAKFTLFTLSVVAIVIFLEDRTLKLSIIVLAVVILFFYFNKFFHFLFRQTVLFKEKDFSSFLFLDLIVLFNVSSALFAFRDFLYFSNWWLLIILGFAVLLIDLFNDLIIYKLERFSLISVLISVIIALEIFWGILSLPFFYYLKASLFAGFFLIYLISKDLYYQRQKNSLVFKLYLIMVLAAVLLILLTAKWF